MTTPNKIDSTKAPRPIHALLRIGLSLIACALLASCAAFRPGFRSPVPPFATPPTTTLQMANRLAQYQPPVSSLRVTLDVVARGGEVKGKEKFTLRMLYRAPDSIMVGADAGTFVGGVLQMTQKDGEVAVYFAKEGQFFRGTLAELDAYPRALNGLRPADLIRAMLVGQEAANQLRAMPVGRALQSTPDYWVLGVLAPGRSENYLLRKSDGLVGEVDVYDTTAAVKARIVYSRYAMFGGVLLPSRFDLYLPGTGLHLTANLEKAAPNLQIPDERFRLTPPGQLVARPLNEWLQHMEMQRQLDEANRQKSNAK